MKIYEDNIFEAGSYGLYIIMHLNVQKKIFAPP